MRIAVAALAVLAVSASARADQHFEEGLRRLDRGQYVEADESFRASEDARAPTLSAVVAASLGKCGAALPTLEAAATGSDPATAKLAGIAAARCSIAEQDFDAAMETLASLPSELGGDPDVLYETARLHLKGWNEAVADMFRSAPGSFRVNQLSAEIFEIQGRYEEAVGEYRKAIAKSPGTLNLHYRLARALLMRSHDPGALEEALVEFRAELALNPNDAAAEFQVAQILQVTGNKSDATEHFERAVHLDPEFPEALVALARQRVRAERYDEAIELLERALALHPDSEPAHYNLMLAYRNSGRRDEAARIQRALERLQAPEGDEFSDFLRRIGETQ